jgi:hypothetical protein
VINGKISYLIISWVFADQYFSALICVINGKTSSPQISRISLISIFARSSARPTGKQTTQRYRGFSLISIFYAHLRDQRENKFPADIANFAD